MLETPFLDRAEKSLRGFICRIFLNPNFYFFSKVVSPRTYLQYLVALANVYVGSHVGDIQPEAASLIRFQKEC